MRLLSVSLLLLCLFAVSGCGSKETERADSATSPSASPVASRKSDADASAATKSPADATVTSKDSNKPDGKPKKPALPTLPLAGEPQLLLSPEEIREGWIQLFDGQTLAGWTPGSNANWHVNADGEIEASEGDIGLLLTTVPFADYELRFDYWMAKGGNSGVFLRTLAEPKVVTADCYELNICDSHPEFKTASLVGRAQPTKEVAGEEVWKSMRGLVDRNRFTVSVDGEVVLDHTDETSGFRRGGLIGLQKNVGRIRFRNVFLKPLGTVEQFNGADLGGWRVVPGSKSEFTVVDGAIVAKNGPGFLETESAWADFALQFEAQVNGDGLNSGVFFRLMPGTEEAPSNGYELQIENVFLNGDRRQPKDNAGTGAIFRRTQARWVVPNDHEWFTTTLIAHGPRIAAWVNGFQVTDWQDTREPDENPRRGSKTAAGPISLQGHDPTTNLAFRNIRVAAYPNE
ncbi:DUF1080 domain-containing protein [bacterium]|nr:DUF1080 domain-containing protein [bacterium]